MCGIIGALAYGEFDADKEKIRQESMIFLTSELLQLTESRGKDATGIVTMFDNCDYMALKMGISATEFVSRFGEKETDYAGFLNVWRETVRPAKMVIGHCRKPSANTSAGPEDNKNNHPIRVGHTIGVHNGTLTNYEKIIEKLNYTSDGEVDSEAIFSLIDSYTREGKEPFSLPLLQSVCKRIHGSFSCLALSTNNPFQMAAFRDGRPAEIALIKPLKLVLFASDKNFLQQVLFRYNRIAKLYSSGDTKFVYLTKGDVKIDTLEDKAIYIFDSSQEITEDTKVEDLYITEKIPIGGKLWYPGRTYNNYTSGYNNNSKRVVKVDTNTPAKSTIVEKKSLESSNTTNGKTKIGFETTKPSEARIGMAWSRQKDKYEDVRNVKYTQSHGSVELSTVSKVYKEINKEFTLSFSENQLDTKESINDDTYIVIKDVTMNHKNSRIQPNTIMLPPPKSIVPVRNTASFTPVKDTTQIIDVTTYPEIMEKAGEASLSVSSFSTLQQVCDVLNIKNTHLIDKLPRLGLINRCKKKFFKEGWYDGYTACTKELKKNGSASDEDIKKNIIERMRMKQFSSRKIIKSAKIIVELLNSLTIPYNDNEIMNVIDKIEHDGKKVDLEYIKKVFKPGDLRRMDSLKCIINAIEKHQTKI